MSILNVQNKKKKKKKRDQIFYIPILNSNILNSFFQIYWKFYSIW